MKTFMMASFGLLLALPLAACDDQGMSATSSHHHHWRGPGSYDSLTTSPTTAPASGPASGSAPPSPTQP